MRLVALSAAACLVLLPVVTAQQSQGRIETHAAPDPLVVDYALHIGDDAPRQSFSVFIEGEIQCSLAADPPPAVGITLNGKPRATVSDDRGTAEYYALGREGFAVPWQEADDEPGLYRIGAEVPITLYSNATNPTDVDQTFALAWAGGFAEPEGTTRCNQAGYGWTVDAAEHTITLPAITGDPDPFPDPTGGSEATPLPTLLPLVALAVLATLRRRK